MTTFITKIGYPEITIADNEAFIQLMPCKKQKWSISSLKNEEREILGYSVVEVLYYHKHSRNSFEYLTNHKNII